MEDHLRELAAPDGPGDKVFETFGGDSAPEREAIVLEAGYAAIRYGYSMVRPTLDDLPDAPLPAGLEIRVVRPEHLAWLLKSCEGRDSPAVVTPPSSCCSWTPGCVGPSAWV